MGRFFLFILFITSLCPDPCCQAQTPIKVSDPRLEMRENIVHISYDILNSQITDKYMVTLEIVDSKDGKIVARAVSGDIGENISGGDHKLIKWDLQADSIYMEADIYIKVREKLIPPSDLVATNSYNRTGLIIQSLALPGLGLSRISGNPHWIRGAAGYGCIAGSIIFNRKAISAYDDYLMQGTAEDARELYQSSTNYDMVSELFGYAAIAIWVTDIIWTVIGTSDLKTNPLYSDTAGFSIATSFEPVTRIPSIGLRYTF